MGIPEDQEQIIEVPKIEYVDKIVDVPKIVTVEKIIEISKDSHERIHEEARNVLVETGTETRAGKVEHVQVREEGEIMDPLTSSVVHAWNEGCQIPAHFANVQLPALPLNQQNPAAGLSASQVGQGLDL